MRLNFQILALFYIASTSAAPAIIISQSAQDVTVFTTAVTNIINALTTFDTSINALTTTTDISTTMDSFSSEVASINSVLNTSTTNVQVTAPLSVGDTISLETPARNLGTSANGTLNDLIAKHDILADAGEAPTIVDFLTTMKTASSLFIAAVVSKVPSALQGPVNSATCDVTDAFNRGITAFGGNANATVCIWFRLLSIFFNRKNIQRSEAFALSTGFAAMV